MYATPHARMLPNVTNAPKNPQKHYIITPKTKSQVKWAQIRNQTPPYIPAAVDPLEHRSSHVRDTADPALDACLAWAPDFGPATKTRSSTAASSTGNSSPYVAVKKATPSAGHEAAEDGEAGKKYGDMRLDKGSSFRSEGMSSTPEVVPEENESCA
jgi:hypothetical protein